MTSGETVRYKADGETRTGSIIAVRGGVLIVRTPDGGVTSVPVAAARVVRF